MNRDVIMRVSPAFLANEHHTAVAENIHLLPMQFTPHYAIILSFGWLFGPFSPSDRAEQ